MLAFATPTTQSSLVFKSTSSLSSRERLDVGRSASRILPRLYLSNLLTAEDEAELSSLRITHVVSVLEIAPKFPPSMSHLKILHIPIEDSAKTDILQYLEQTTHYIKSALEEDEKNAVLVHCFMGMSRSATVVCAYLIATTDMLPSDAVQFVRDRRSIVCLNIGFRDQLETYAAKFCGKGQKARGRYFKVNVGVIERIMFWKGGARIEAKEQEGAHPLSLT
ncbi:protein-tyrosine phosphatase-like protein [Sparassis latifolia]